MTTGGPLTGLGAQMPQALPPSLGVRTRATSTWAPRPASLRWALPGASCPPGVSPARPCPGLAQPKALRHLASAQNALGAEQGPKQQPVLPPGGQKRGARGGPGGLKQLTRASLPDQRSATSRQRLQAGHGGSVYPTESREKPQITPPAPRATGLPPSHRTAPVPAPASPQT